MLNFDGSYLLATFVSLSAKFSREIVWKVQSSKYKDCFYFPKRHEFIEVRKQKTIVNILENSLKNVR